MAAGTVISGGFPGRVAQEVQPNPKCNGCLHFDGQGGRTGICSIGLKPWGCGDGDAADIGYAPIARGAGTYLPDMDNHGAHAPEVGDQDTSDLTGAGSVRPVTFQQVSLGEEHVHFAKSFIAQHDTMQKSMCRLCKSTNMLGTTHSNIGPQSCTCEKLSALTVAKAIAARCSNLERSILDMDDLIQFVYACAKSNFDPSIVKGTFYHAHGKYEVSPAGGGEHHVDFHPKGGGKPTRVATVGSHREGRNATMLHAKRFASGTGADNDAPSKPKSTHTPPGLPSMKEAVSVAHAKKSEDEDDLDKADEPSHQGSTITRDRSQFRLTGPDHVHTMHRTLSGAKAHAERGASHYGSVRHIKDPAEAEKFHASSLAAFQSSRELGKSLAFDDGEEMEKSFNDFLMELHNEEDVEKSLRWSHKAAGQASTSHGKYTVAAHPDGGHTVTYTSKTTGKSHAKTFASHREALGAVTEHHLKNRPPPKKRGPKKPKAPGAGAAPAGGCPPCP